ECHTAGIKARSKIPGEVKTDLDAENASDTASIIIDILGQNYGTHNIASNILVLTEDIRSGRIKPFIKFNNDKSPVACAALVQINENEVELGRAACIKDTNGGNGQLMIEAFNQWKNKKLFPESKILRAEVRTAKATKEVPGGQATQVICLNKIGFVPTAMGPMFHHGIPDRQEVFLLASIMRENNNHGFDSEKLIPTSIGEIDERKMFSIFWKKFFGKLPNFSETNTNGSNSINLEARVSGPIIEIKTSENANDVDQIIENFFEIDGRFALARIPIDLPIEQMASVSSRLRKNSFRLAGFEPSIKGNNISIDILFGRLSEIGKRLMVLPSFAENIFDHREEEILIQNSILWRQI
ncbi:MAG: hypothetical protein WC503_03410, partial [Candidatus Shapirobacteria bacterium]